MKGVKGVILRVGTVLLGTAAYVSLEWRLPARVDGCPFYRPAAPLRLRSVRTRRDALRLWGVAVFCAGRTVRLRSESPCKLSSATHHRVGRLRHITPNSLTDNRRGHLLLDCVEKLSFR